MTITINGVATVRPRIAHALSGRDVRTKATEQYIRVLASQAKIEGIDLGAAASPFVE